MTLNINGSVVEFSMVVEDASDAMSLINILTCLDYESKEYCDLYHFLEKTINLHMWDGEDDWDEAFWELANVEHDAYYEHNIGKFNEYCTHMDEPDFDWDFYSDWHKDLFGFRPRG